MKWHPLQTVMIAKTNPKQTDTWLPLPFHALDTAGMMQQLLRTRYALLAQSCGYAYLDLQRVAMLLAYLHDLGKQTPLFQSKILVAVPACRAKFEHYGMDIAPYEAFKNTACSPHARAGEAILRELGFPADFASIVGAHHGMPADGSVELLIEENPNHYFGKPNRRALWRELWENTVAFALEQAGFSAIADIPPLSQPAQVLLSGLLIMADWLASNQQFFPLISIDDTPDMTAYPSERIAKAWDAIAFPEPWTPALDGFSATEFVGRFSFPPNAVQRAVLDAIAACRNRPGIFVLEAPMGIGKTEAALAGAELLAKRCQKTGLFLGLPTQATANGIFDRVKGWAEQQSEEFYHSILLAHGNAECNQAFANLHRGLPDAGVDSDSGLMIHPFFTGRKQACLADFVVATVDRMLMSALRQKHTMLYHLGLSQKVVVIDECHAYDAYMNQYLDRALTWLGTYGVPVILLSATLPAQRRVALVQAYLWNAQPNASDAWKHETAYPLLTWTDGNDIAQQAIPVELPPRDIAIAAIADDAVLERVQFAVQAGGCVGVICNTVKRAQQFAQMMQAIPDAQVIQYHARYLLPDRAEKESELLQRIGKASTPEQRKGVVVVGTQVLEQSLDIDFDWLITDLCPMDLLLQRIGRLQRHASRDALRPAGLRTATCWVLGALGDELEQGSARIYGEWLLLRTKQLLPAQITIPKDIAPLVQSTYESPTPDGAQEERAWTEHQQAIAKKTARGKAFTIGLPVCKQRNNTLHGWLSQNMTDTVAEATVRDGEPSLEVLVLQRTATGQIRFLPWCEGGGEIPTHCCPDETMCRAIARQKLRLPSAVCGRWNVDAAIRALETMNQCLAAWQASNKLRGELVLLLDEELCAELNGCDLRYSRADGLTYERKESNV